jgi:hypothetical protein
MDLSIEKYEQRKCEELLKRGFPKDLLWLTECERVDKETGCVFYHESGNIYGLAFFKNEKEFQKALDYLVKNVVC